MKNVFCLVLIVLMLLFADTIPGYAVDRGGPPGGGGYLAIMVEAAGMAGVAIMVEAAGMAGVAIMVEAAGMVISGLGQDGVDGARGGGVLLIIHTIIHTIRKHPRSSNSSLRYMSSQRNSIIGISAKIPRGTIHI